MAGSACNSSSALVVQLGTSWAGNDGNWSTFSIAAGTPPQSFSVLPATGSGEVWLPVPQGCLDAPSVPACAASRGVEPINGTQSEGFMTNASSSWNLIGLYTLATDSNLFGSSDNGLYGRDTVILGQDVPGAVSISTQVIAGIATPDFWLGTLGLGITADHFDGVSNNMPSLLSSMRHSNVIPSLSFAYNSGAHYRPSSASLIYGGYDHGLFGAGTATYALNTTNSTELRVNIEGIVVTNSLEAPFSMPLNGTALELVIDSSVSQMWLPESICDSFASAFNLTYDNETDLYLFDNASREQLLSLNPEVTVTLISDTNKTTNIVYPFSAFDLNVGLPLYNESTPYFPIRRAANQSQYVLGRAFLQEAYIVVDYEHQNMTIGQINHNTTLSGQLTAICPQASLALPRGMDHGTVAGIAVGVVLGCGLLGFVGWYLWLRLKRKQREARRAADYFPELESKEKDKIEILSTEIHELRTKEREQQLMSTPIYELQGDYMQAELPTEETRYDKK